MFGSRALGLGLSLLLVSSAFGGSAYDFNGDGRIDLTDYQLLATCLASGGPDQATGVECAAFGADTDLQDAAGFLNAFSGSARFNDNCVAPIQVGDGTHSFDSTGATTDGLPDPACDFIGHDQVDADLWYCYTATCTGTAVVSVCGSDFDTKLAVYDGCGCPSVSPMACSDDDCGFDVITVQSRVDVPVVEGQSYMVRVGGYDGAVGIGILTLGCNVEPCQTATHDCLAPSPEGTPGCENAECCAATCNLDQFCCDVNWDQKCAAEAEGVCDGHFAACSAGAGACDDADGTPGCNDDTCCNRVCFFDPFCCLNDWDSTCVNEAAAACFLTCGAGALGGGCFVDHVTPGCSDQACCELVCDPVKGDSFCCETEWDALCVVLATELCP